MPIFFSLVCSRAFGDTAHSRFWFQDPKLWLLDFLKMLVLVLPQFYTRVFHLWKSIALNSAWIGDSGLYLFSFLLRVFARLAMIEAHSRFWYRNPKLCLLGSFKDASFGPPPNRHKCISLLEIYRIGKCLGWRFSPVSIFFSLASSCTFSVAAQSRLWCRDP